MGELVPFPRKLPLFSVCFRTLEFVKWAVSFHDSFVGCLSGFRVGWKEGGWGEQLCVCATDTVPLLVFAGTPSNDQFSLCDKGGVYFFVYFMSFAGMKLRNDLETDCWIFFWGLINSVCLVCCAVFKVHELLLVLSWTQNLHKASIHSVKSFWKSVLRQSWNYNFQEFQINKDIKTVL